MNLPNEYDPTVSGDVDSFETSEFQNGVLDPLKLIGKIAMMVSETAVKFKVEKPEGFKNFIYQLDKASKSGKPLDQDEAIALEQKVRFEERDERIGNRTETYRMLLGNLMGNKAFQERLRIMTEEVMDFSNKREGARKFVLDKTQKDLGW